MYASKSFNETNQARLVVAMMRDVQRASFSIGDAFWGVFVSDSELIARAEENTDDENNVNGCGFEPAATAEDFNQYWTGRGTYFAWRVWTTGRGQWHAEARIGHRDGAFTPQSTLLWACEKAGFVCDVKADKASHNEREAREAFNEGIRYLWRKDVDVSRLNGVKKVSELEALKQYLALCEEQLKRLQEQAEVLGVPYDYGYDYDDDEVILGESTLAKLRGSKPVFQDEA